MYEGAVGRFSIPIQVWGIPLLRVWLLWVVLCRWSCNFLKCNAAPNTKAICMDLRLWMTIAMVHDVCHCKSESNKCSEDLQKSIFHLIWRTGSELSALGQRRRRLWDQCAWRASNTTCRRFWRSGLEPCAIFLANARTTARDLSYMSKPFALLSVCFPISKWGIMEILAQWS